MLLMNAIDENVAYKMGKIEWGRQFFPSNDLDSHSFYL